MKIAVVVHGRFYAFDLVKALIARGHDVTLFTNYPLWIVRRFQVPAACVRSFWFHGLLSKTANRVDPDDRLSIEKWLHPMFGAWARNQLLKEGPWDAIHSFSGVSEEILRCDVLRPCVQLVRASSHIEVQARILAEEETRAGMRLDHPSRWIIQRELREYELAPTIVVLSEFARRTFLERGVPESKLRLMPLGADLRGFWPAPEIVDERIRRIRAGEPLTIVYAGSVSFRKGMFDLARIIHALGGRGFRFRLAGSVMKEGRQLVKELEGEASFLGKVPQETLPQVYASGDLFLFPTIEDGFPVVLAQAQTSGLPVLSSANCAAAELIRDGHGWVLPIRTPELFIERLLWCDSHREELAQMVRSLYVSGVTRDYDTVAADFEEICERESASIPAVRSAPRPLKIAVVVHGRFHAFDLARALIARGMNVSVFTSYPFWVAERWGIPRKSLRTFPLYGVLSRFAGQLREKISWSADGFLHPLFSRWAVRRLRTESWDVIYSFSGISEEIDREPALSGALRIMVRGSAHIRVQQQILSEEEQRTGEKLDLPSKWMIGREEREYQLADRIVVLSSFAYDSFRTMGVPPEKLRILPLGTETSAFRPVREVIEARRNRILADGPLRVLFVGGLAWRKGLADLRDLVAGVERNRFHFRFVGPVWQGAESVVASLTGRAEFPGKRPQRELPGEYAWGDVFVFPTLEDGYAVVLAQACASGLPILATSNCCGPDLIREGRTGWVLPIRSPEAFRSRLEWCDTHRKDLAEMVTAAYTEFRTRDWSDVAADLEALCRAEIAGDSGLNDRARDRVLARNGSL